MGTRSKLIIRRKAVSSKSGASKPDIHLWMHYDGCFDCVGNDLVNQIVVLLAKYRPERIQEMISALDLDDDAESTFDSSDLVELLEGSAMYAFNDCDDIEYKYVLDTDTQTLVGKHCGTGDVRRLTFDDMKMGKNFDDFCYDSDAEDDDDGLTDGLTVTAFIAMLQKMVKENPKLANKRVQGDIVFN